MAFKIGIAGTHSTGKTTFLNELEAKIRSLGLRVNRVSDIGSQAAEAGFPILRDHTLESTLWIMSQGVANELKAGLDCDVLLVDRPIPDAISISRMRSRASFSSGKMDPLNILSIASNARKAWSRGHFLESGVSALPPLASSHSGVIIFGAGGPAKVRHCAPPTSIDVPTEPLSPS